MWQFCEDKGNAFIWNVTNYLLQLHKNFNSIHLKYAHISKLPDLIRVQQLHSSSAFVEVIFEGDAASPKADVDGFGGVEDFAGGGECVLLAWLVADSEDGKLDGGDDVEGHLFVTSPGDVLHLVGDEDGGDVVLLFEDLGGVGGEGGGFVGAGEGDNGSWGDERKIAHILLF